MVLPRPRLDRRRQPTKLPTWNLPKPAAKDIAERICKLWRSPAVRQATKAADTYAAKALAKLNEVLARLNAKK